jgi:hypothetical protein
MKDFPLLHVVLDMHLMNVLLERQQERELELVLMVHPKQVFLVQLKNSYHL